MPRRTTTTTALAVLLAGGALAGVGAAPAAAATCARVPDIGPTGADPADAINIRTTNVGCTKARSIIRKYVPASVRNYTPSGVRVGAYKCKDSMDSRGYIRVRCTASDSRSIRWKFG
jgi:hypothetical protein